MVEHQVVDSGSKLVTTTTDMLLQLIFGLYAVYIVYMDIVY